MSLLAVAARRRMAGKEPGVKAVLEVIVICQMLTLLGAPGGQSLPP